MGSQVKIYFIKPGLQTLVQDNGRMGQQAFGVPVGGVMDKSAARIANWLVGNDVKSPLLEIALTGPHIEFEGDCQIAIAGADISPTIDGKPVNMYQTITVNDGTELKFRALKNGCRAYLSIGGDWQIKKWLNSSSAFLLSDQNLTPDSIPVKGDHLVIEGIKNVDVKSFPPRLQPKHQSPIQIGIIPGPEFDDFSKKAVDHFLNNQHTISNDYNRMGYRLETILSDFDPKQEVISSGIVPGTIQITNSGQPIILMADAQTTGGYPRIGNVITAHMDKLAQAKPGDQIKFSLVKLEDAYQALRDNEATMNLLLK